MTKEEAREFNRGSMWERTSLGHALAQGGSGFSVFGIEIGFIPSRGRREDRVSDLGQAVMGSHRYR